MQENEQPAKPASQRWQKRKLQLFNNVAWTCPGCGTADRELDVHFFARTTEDPADEDSGNLIVLCTRCLEVEKLMRGEAEKFIATCFRLKRMIVRDLFAAGSFLVSEFSSRHEQAAEDLMAANNLLTNEALGHPDVADLLKQRDALKAQVDAAIREFRDGGEITPEHREMGAKLANVSRLIAAFVDDYARRTKGKLGPL